MTSVIRFTLKDHYYNLLKILDYDNHSSEMEKLYHLILYRKFIIGGGPFFDLSKPGLCDVDDILGLDYE